jgi:hypothetical protein
VLLIVGTVAIRVTRRTGVPEESPIGDTTYAVIWHEGRVVCTGPDAPVVQGERNRDGLLPAKCHGATWGGVTVTIYGNILHR